MTTEPKPPQRRRNKRRSIVDLRLLSGDALREAIDQRYAVDPQAGKVYHLPKGKCASNVAAGRFGGKEAGTGPASKEEALKSTRTNQRYWRVTFLSRNYLRSRFIWAYYHGEWPTLSLDHIDGDISNDSIDNLRQATAAEQAANFKKYSTNTSGVTGVKQLKNGKWLAYIGAWPDRLAKTCATREEAVAARAEFEEQRYAEFREGRNK